MYNINIQFFRTVLTVVTVFICICTQCVSASTTVGVATLFGSPDCDYSTSMSINGVVFDVIIDTGSSNLAIASSQCTNCNVSPLYSGSLDTAQPQINVTYGEGSWVGSEATDSITFGGIKIGANFVGITTQNQFFTAGCPGNEGILGLAYPDLAEGGITPLFDDLVSAGVPNGFAIQLCGSSSNSLKKTGNMWLGGFDTSYISGEMQFTPVVQQLFYNVDLVSFSVNGQVLSINIPSAVIVDSGTSNLVVSQANFDTIITALQNSNAITFSSQTEADFFWTPNECTGYLTNSEVSISSQSVFFVTFAGQNGQPDIAVEILTLGWARKYFYTDTLSYYCLGIEASQQDTLIIGETVSYGHVVYYDRANTRVGFALGTKCSVEPTAQGINVFAFPNASLTYYGDNPTSSALNQSFQTTSLLIILHLLHLFMQAE